MQYDRYAEWLFVRIRVPVSLFIRHLYDYTQQPEECVILKRLC